MKTGNWFRRYRDAGTMKLNVHAIFAWIVVPVITWGAVIYLLVR